MRSRYRLQLLIGFLPVVLLTAPFILDGVLSEIRHFRMVRAHERAFQEAVQETDARDPNWRWEQVLASQVPLPDAQNLYLQLPAISARSTTLLGRRPSGVGHLFDDLTQQVPPNQLPEEDEIAELRLHQQNLAPAVKLARLLDNFPRGQMLIPLSANPFTFPLNHPQQLREVANLLRYEAERLAIDQRAAETIPYLRIIFHAGDTMSEDLYMISHLVRGALYTTGVNAIQRVLGLTQPGAELETILASLERSRSRQQFALALRGERALSQAQFDLCADNPQALLRLIQSIDLNTSYQTEEPMQIHEYPLYVALDRANMLRAYQEVIDTGSLPLHEQAQAMTRIVERNRRRENPMTNAALQVLLRYHAGEQRTQGFLDCARVGVACELYRQEHGQWPQTLEMIPKKWLAEVPRDPFDGQPLRYRIMADRIRVYSVGLEGIEEEDSLPEDPSMRRTNPRFEVWNPDQRRLASPPPRPEELPFPNELPEPEPNE